MALVVEDGTIVTGADSYVSLADARTRAAILGVDISSTDGTAELQLQQAFIYVNRTYRSRFRGNKTNVTQEPQFPRIGVYLDDELIASDEIPQELIDAQIYVASHIESGDSLYPNNDGRSVASESVGGGAVSVSYFNTGKTGTKESFTDVETAIRPLLMSGGKYKYDVRR